MVRKLLYINGLAIISVVLYHASAWGFISMFWWTHRYRPVGEVNFDQLFNFEYYSLRIIEQLVIFAIPAFIFVCGYYVAVATGRNNKTIAWKTVLNRIKVLAIPFIVWSVIYIVFNIFKGERYTALDFFLIIITGKVSDPFYFIPLLIQLYLLAPFLVFLIKKGWKPVLAVSAVIQVLVLVFRYISIIRPDHLPLFSTLSENIFFSSYLFWFVLGIVVAFNSGSFKALLVKYRKLYLVGTIVFFIIGVLEWETIFRTSGLAYIPPTETLIDHIYAIFLIFSLFAYEGAQFPFFNRLTGLGTQSYGIYLSHSLALESSARIIYHIFPSVMEFTIVFLFIIVIAGLGIPLLLMYLVSKLPIRRYYSYLFG